MWVTINNKKIKTLGAKTYKKKLKGGASYMLKIVS